MLCPNSCMLCPKVEGASVGMSLSAIKALPMHVGLALFYEQIGLARTQNRIYTPYMTVYLVISLQKLRCTHRFGQPYEQVNQTVSDRK